MINLRAIRDRVLQRLALIRNPDEEQMHQAYSHEIHNELTTAVETARELRLFFQEVRARRPDRSWVMVGRADVEHYEQLVERFLLELR